MFQFDPEIIKERIRPVPETTRIISVPGGNSFVARLFEGIPDDQVYFVNQSAIEELARHMEKNN